MTTLNVADQEVLNAANQGLHWLNLSSNSLQPFKLDRIESATKDESGVITILCNLRMFDNDHPFRLVVNTAANGPAVLADFKQLN